MTTKTPGVTPHFAMRVPKDVLAVWKQAAEKKGLSVSIWARHHLTKLAKRQINASKTVSD